MSALPPPEWRIEIDGQEVSALYQPGAGTTAGREVLFVCAHGAGGQLRDRGMERVAEELVARGMSFLRFNFLYRERGSGRPDPMPLLERTVVAAAEHARREVGPAALILGGRSMGGRAASMLAAKGYECDGLLLLAYPLHPAGKPDRLRDEHLPQIHVPVLCFNGTRDELCRRDLMDATLERVGADWTMHWLEGADHSFHVLKSSGRTDAEVLREVGARTLAWLEARHLSTGASQQ